MESKIAIYAGTFDPFTFGHQYVAEQASKMFNVLYVALGASSKAPKYSANERMELLKWNLGHLNNVIVVDLGDQLLGQFAKEKDIKFLVKGIRSNVDFDYEKITQRVMEDSFPELTTVYLIPPRDYEHVSSSLVRNLLLLPNSEQLVNKYLSNITNYRLFKNLGEGMEAQLHYLKGTWEYVFSKRNLSYSKRPLVNEEFYKLINLYMSKGRYYHTIDHLYDCMKLLAKFPSSFELQVALFFHDAIYDPTRRDNEENSAELADAFLKELGCNRKIRDRVRRLIMVTNHQIDPLDDEERLIIDIDLSIFSNRSKFWSYEENIRKEYNFVPDKEYAKVRSSILMKFLNRGDIYYHAMPEFNHSLAKENLQLAYLKLGEILRK